MEKFLIEGGYSLKGQVSVSGNKNEALPVIAACLLAEETVVLENVPRIGDVEIMLSIIDDLGAQIQEISKNEIAICCKNLKNIELDKEKCASLRASILLAGPLLARFGSVKLPPPGGDVIGRRRLDTHFLIFRELGANIESEKNYLIESKELFGKDIFLDEPSVTATENALMTAVLAKGETILRNAACEPHVSGLANMLVSMGAQISGIGTNILKISGIEKLCGTKHKIGSDYLEIGSLISLAAVTNSEIKIENVDTFDLNVIDSTYRKLGIHFQISNNEVFVPADQPLRIQSDFSGDIPKIYDGPWPAFPSDLMSISIVTATQANGTVLFFEKMYESRLFFVDYLIAMGAKIVLCDPHRIVIVGPSQLFGSRLQSPDIRAGMSLIIAALCAEGESSIYNIKQIDRGYENLEQKLQQLGAKIRRVVE